MTELSSKELDILSDCNLDNLSYAFDISFAIRKYIQEINIFPVEICCQFKEYRLLCHLEQSNITETHLISKDADNVSILIKISEDFKPNLFVYEIVTLLNYITIINNDIIIKNIDSINLKSLELYLQKISSVYTNIKKDITRSEIFASYKQAKYELKEEQYLYLWSKICQFAKLFYEKQTNNCLGYIIFNHNSIIELTQSNPNISLFTFKNPNQEIYIQSGTSIDLNTPLCFDEDLPWIKAQKRNLLSYIPYNFQNFYNLVENASEEILNLLIKFDIIFFGLSVIFKDKDTSETILILKDRDKITEDSLLILKKTG